MRHTVITKEIFCMEIVGETEPEIRTLEGKEGPLTTWLGEETVTAIIP